MTSETKPTKRTVTETKPGYKSVRTYEGYTPEEIEESEAEWERQQLRKQLKSEADQRTKWLVDAITKGIPAIKQVIANQILESEDGLVRLGKLETGLKQTTTTSELLDKNLKALTESSEKFKKVELKTTIDRTIDQRKEDIQHMVDKSMDKAVQRILPGLVMGRTPSGGIIMWSGLKANIPSGWAFCDGTNGTPDLRDKFILSVGAAEEPGDTGGNLSLAHYGCEVANHPALGHSGMSVYDHAAKNTSAASYGGSYSGPTTSTLTLAAHTHGITAYGHSWQNPSAHPILTHSVTQPDDHADIRPPFYKLAFIMKL